MSLSATDGNSSYQRVSSGKTPPPAPSAAYAKRYFISIHSSNIHSLRSFKELGNYKQKREDIDHQRCALHWLPPMTLYLQQLQQQQSMALSYLLLITPLGLGGQGPEPYLQMYNSQLSVSLLLQLLWAALLPLQTPSLINHKGSLQPSLPL
jgi:hypothetical protein